MIWLVGNKGMLGTEVEGLLRTGDAPYLVSDRDVDITQTESPARFLSSQGVNRLDWIINCAAYTAVDLAEDQPERAFALNEGGVRTLREAAKSVGARLLHISTDYVFDGTKEGDYGEEDAPNPLGVYGKSKLAGELVLQDAREGHVILRTAWLYGTHGKNFVATMLRLFKERDRVTVVDDQWGNPTYAPDLARAIMTIVEAVEVPGGIYHCTNGGRTNWYGFAMEIYAQALSREMARPGVTVAPIRSSEYPTKVRRPANSCLSKEKIGKAFGMIPRDWHETLRSYFDEETK